MNTQEIKDRVKLIVIFVVTIIITIIGTSVFMQMAAQTRPYMVTTTTDKSSGRDIETRKDCLSVSVTDNDIIFIINGTTYQAFQRDGVDKYGKPAWEDVATKKRVGIYPQEDGRICITKTDKKYFCYTPTKKIQQ